MKLLEYKAHELFREYKVPCSEGYVVSDPGELSLKDGVIPYPVVLKAQVQTGGRGKAGGVQFAENRSELVEKGKQIFNLKIKDLPVNKLFVASRVSIKREMYLSITLDRKLKMAVLIFSPQGGVDINEIAEKHPEKVVKVHLPAKTYLDEFFIQYVMDTSGLEEIYRPAFKDICNKLYRMFVERNCMLVEINPLVIDDNGQLMALDGKIDVDDNALYKHPDILAFRDEITDNPYVLAARKFDFLYIPVKDQGDIAVISNGSGMIMSSIDLITKRGMTVTCALDLGGGATAARVQEALKIVASNPRVKTIFINIFGGITRCDEIAGGIGAAMDTLGDTVLVVRFEGTNKEKGLEIIRNTAGNIEMADGLYEGVDVLARRMAV